MPRVVLLAIAAFYLLQFTGLCMWLLRSRRPFAAWPVAALIVSFSLVHTVFWSNARMRAPVIPAIAVLAIAGAVRANQRGSDCSKTAR